MPDVVVAVGHFVFAAAAVGPVVVGAVETVEFGEVGEVEVVALDSGIQMNLGQSVLMPA